MALNPPLPAWPDCRVWVIGASTGIGAATARRLLSAGARVAISARQVDRLSEVANGHANARVEPLDFTDSAQIAAAWQRIRAAWGGADLVLIVAGTHAEIRAWELTEQNAMALLETNLHGVIKSTAVVLPALLAQGKGALGIVSSIAGYRGLPKALIYGASKAALINFTETLYLDLRPKGLGVYLINPGFVKTPLTDRNEFRMPHLITAEEAATAIVAGLRAGEFEIDFPKAFTRQLKCLRILPYRWYFALIRRATGL
ncbi:MAG TPA: SDR family NAD(P)-dependent oxidoreductase [Casimicrobiaceae bacterium]|jgi:short-subunit dehydrogenase|nr:SDR family NAD(P)-dependent oxidoreductase [Casimicrobiaceae bacterium]